MIWSVPGRRKELLAGVFLVAMTISHVVMMPGLVPLLRSGYQNFTIFYTAGKMVREGRSAALYDLSAQYEVQKQFAPNVAIRQAALPFNHPPFEALLFVPLAGLPFWPAYLCWTALNVVMAVAGLLVLRRQYAELRPVSAAFLCLAAAGFYPLVSALVQGQDCVLLLLVYVLALSAFQKNHDVTAGALLAAGLFRFQLALPLVVLLSIQRKRLLLGFTPTAALLAVLSLLMMGWGGVEAYVRLLLNLEQSGGGGSIVAASMPNVRGIVAGLPGLGAGSALTAIVTIALSIAVLAIASWRIHIGRQLTLLPFALATVAAILVSYHALTYDLSLLLPVILLVFFTARKDASQEVQVDLIVLILLFVISAAGTFGSSATSVLWFALLVGWVFWKFGSGHSPAGVFPESSPERASTTPSIGR
jgi:alpha-1,2-mannosyltransferase